MRCDFQLLSAPHGLHPASCFCPLSVAVVGPRQLRPVFSKNGFGSVGAFSHASYCSIPCSPSFPLFELHGPVTSHLVSRVAVWCSHGPAPHSGVTSTPSASRVHGWREWEPPVCGQHCAGRSHTPLSPSPVPFSNFNVSPRMPSMLPACLSI